jgi:hypothetical protein
MICCCERVGLSETLVLRPAYLSRNNSHTGGTGEESAHSGIP